MTNQDYEARKRECWEQFCRHIVDEEEEFYNMFDRAYALGREKESITQEDVEKEAEKYAINVNDKRLSAYPEQFRSQLSPEYDVTDLVDAFAAGVTFSLGKQEKDAEDTVISGWVARDKDNNLFIYSDKPKRVYDGEFSRWEGLCLDTISNSLFPDLTWDDDPIEVELIIKRKRK